MKIGVRIDRLNNQPDSKVKAYASITMDGAFAVHGLRVAEGQKGLFVSMPSTSYTDRNGEKKYSDTFHPVTAEARTAIQNAVLNAYNQAVQQSQAAQFEVESEPMEPTWA